MRYLLLLPVLYACTPTGWNLPIRVCGHNTGPAIEAFNREFRTPLFVDECVDTQVIIGEGFMVVGGGRDILGRASCWEAPVSYCEITLQPGMRPQLRAYILAHELGHVLGLEHIADEDSLMCAVVDVSREFGPVRLDDQTITEIQRIYKQLRRAK